MTAPTYKPVLPGTQDTSSSSVSPDAYPPQALPTAPMPTAASTPGWAMGGHHTGDSGAHLELKDKGEARKEKVGAGGLRIGNGGGGMWQLQLK